MDKITLYEWFERNLSLKISCLNGDFFILAILKTFINQKKKNMRRLFTTVLAACAVAFAAQAGGKKGTKTAYPIPNHVGLYEEGVLKAPEPIVGSLVQSGGSWGDTIGATSYDLQTNATMQSRLSVDANGNKTAVWTGDVPGAGGGPLRNIGYNYYDATAGAWQGSSLGIRSGRCGWPSVARNDGAEYLFSHTPQYGNFRATPGSGAWSEDTATAFMGTTFSNSTSDGNNIHHVIANTVGGVGAFTYSRSTDGGTTWDIQADSMPALLGDLIPGNTFSLAEGFAIAANNGVVAIVSGGFQNPTNLFKSTDNGTTWTKTTIASIDTNLSQFDGTYNVDYTMGCSYAVTIDGNGDVHMAANGSSVGSTPGTQDAAVYYPFGNVGLYYWNESMGTVNMNDSVARAGARLLSYVDEDGDGIDGTPYTLDSVGSYYVHNSLGFPGITFDAASGAVVVTWNAVREDLLGLGVTTPGSEGKVAISSDVYGIASFDGGMTWEAPRNIAEDLAGAIGTSWTEEDVFLYAYPWTVNGDVHITWQSDDHVDRQFDSTIPGITLSSMVSYSFPPSALGLAENVEANVDLGVYPNPAQDMLHVDLSLKTDANYSIQMTNMLGQVVLEQSADLVQGNNTVDLDVNSLTPGVYVVAVKSGQSAVTTKVIVE